MNINSMPLQTVLILMECLEEVIFITSMDADTILVQKI